MSANIMEGWIKLDKREKYMYEILNVISENGWKNKVMKIKVLLYFEISYRIKKSHLPGNWLSPAFCAQEAVCCLVHESHAIRTGIH